MIGNLKRLIKNHIIVIAVCLSILAGFIIIFTGISLYKKKINGGSLDDALQYHKYKYHYALISGEEDEPFWQAIYDGALEKGIIYDAFVERVGNNLSISYSLQDLIRIAIASKVDGIIVEPDGKEETTLLIDEAEANLIPVITVLNDAPGSNRKSFVGVNCYNQGQLYADQVLEVLDENTDKVVVLLDSDSKDDGQDMIYTTVSGMINNENIIVEAAFINTDSTFSSQESIRDIIMDTEEPPDILVCPTVTGTLCAYQAVVDYNKVGVIEIIGYYDSELILSAIDKNIIHSTMIIDANQLGASCVEALMEYNLTSQVSDYFTVDIGIINSSNISSYIDDKKKE